MKPRKSPGRTEFAASALNDMGLHVKHHGTELAAAVGVWKGNFKTSGLPESWSHESLLGQATLDGHQVFWRVYVVDVQGVYMGFAESLDGAVLALVALLPVAAVTRTQAVQETQARIPWNSRYA